MDTADESGRSLNDELAKIIADVENLENGGEPTGSPKVQHLIRRNIHALERMTRAVSQLAMFSENEDADEIATDSLRFLLLPALLGFYTGKHIADNRLENLLKEQVELKRFNACRSDVAFFQAYYKDFLVRLQSYNIIKRINEEENIGGDSSDPQRNLVALARNRQFKIERFNQRRSLEEKLRSLRERSSTSAGVDEELKRDLFSTELKMWAMKVNEDVETVQQEIELMRTRMDPKFDATVSASINSTKRPQPPLKPFIIAKSDLQKAVFGMGYPSLPTMSLEEFFEQKRREGQVGVVSGSEEQQGPITEEEEQILREREEERENPDLLQHDRDYDEYKDDHRRGCGNVHNKG